MPEHVHLLLSEPEKASLATAVQALKQSVSRRLALRHAEPFWQARYYDFNFYTEAKRIEKLRYMHRNPVVRGLARQPEDCLWSSFRHYATGIEGAVEIESEWTARKRERMGLRHEVRKKPRVQFPRPSGARTGHPAPRGWNMKPKIRWATRPQGSESTNLGAPSLRRICFSPQGWESTNLGVPHPGRSQDWKA